MVSLRQAGTAGTVQAREEEEEKVTRLMRLGGADMAMAMTIHTG